MRSSGSTGRGAPRSPRPSPGLIADEDLERAQLVDVRTGRIARLPEVVDYPVLALVSPDGRWVWVEDKEGNGGT